MGLLGLCNESCSGFIMFCACAMNHRFDQISCACAMNFAGLCSSRLGFDETDDFLAAPVMAVGVAVCQKMATYPLDTVSRRMMMTSGEVVKYQSSIHAFAEIIRNEGVKSLYKGGGACILEKITLSVILTVFVTRMQNFLYTKKSNSAADSVSAKRNGSAGGGQSASTLAIKWTYGKKD